jgi:hypothetical protein
MPSQCPPSRTFRCVLATVAVMSALLMREAQAEQPERVAREDIVGTWRLVSSYSVLRGGGIVHPYGGAAEGVLMLDGNGHFSLTIIGSDIPRFRSGNRHEGTPEENQAAVEGTEAFFGTYDLNEVGRVLTFNIQRSSFPNRDWTRLRASIILEADRMEYQLAGTPSRHGLSIARYVWKRIRSFGFEDGYFDSSFLQYPNP